jgi:fibrillarin-like pre-rRNA processing protein
MVLNLQPKKIFEGVYEINGRIATLNSTPGKRAYSEELKIVDRKEYRLWNPYRSKLSAAIALGLKNFHFKNSDKVLYIGAATGTTVSHISDIVVDGRIYCIEMSERNMRELVKLCESRPNMLPILADASEPNAYSDYIETCDVLYQDASAREQAKILLSNARFLKRGGYAYFVIKSQSIDISKKPREIFESELKILENDFEVIEKTSLDPYDKLHLFSVLKKK